jgi:hypothetical protein
MADQWPAKECHAVAAIDREQRCYGAGSAVTMGESCENSATYVALASCATITAFGESIGHLASERKFGRMPISPSGSPSW